MPTAPHSRHGGEQTSSPTDPNRVHDVAAPGPDRRRDALIDGSWLAAVALLLRLPAYLSAKHLTFDDGVFASSVTAMRDGGVPFREVFSSQGPLFLPLAYLGDLLGGRGLDSPRVVAVVSGIVCTLGVYWCASQLADRTAAVLAGLLTATSGSLMWVTGPLAADGPALAFGVVAFGTALRLRAGASLPRAAVLGVLVGATLSTKSLEAPVLVPAALVLLAPFFSRQAPAGDTAEAPTSARRRLRMAAAGRIAVASCCALGVYLAVSLPFGFSEVWDQSFSYRADAAVDREPLANASKIISTLWDRDLVLLLFLLLTALLAFLPGLRGSERPTMAGEAPPDEPAQDRAQPTARLLVALWALATLVWLVLVVSPLWRPHVSALVPPLVLVVAAWRPPTRVLLVAGVLSLPLLWVQLDDLLLPGDYEGSEAEIVDLLEELPEGAWALSDEPGLLWRAGIRTTDDLVDPSMLRVQQGRYDSESVLQAASDPRVCAVVVRSGRRFGSFEGLGDALAGIGYTVAHSDGTHGRVYVREACTPSG